MAGFGDNKTSKKKLKKNLIDDNLKEKIIYKAFKSHSDGNIAEAAKYYQSFINQGFADVKVFSNLLARDLDMEVLHGFHMEIKIYLYREIIEN